METMSMGLVLPLQIACAAVTLSHMPAHLPTCLSHVCHMSATCWSDAGQMLSPTQSCHWYNMDRSRHFKASRQQTCTDAPGDHAPNRVVCAKQACSHWQSMSQRLTIAKCWLVQQVWQALLLTNDTSVKTRACILKSIGRCHSQLIPI